jgi:hypothetical protein
MKDDSPRSPPPDTPSRLYSLLFVFCRAESRLVVRNLGISLETRFPQLACFQRVSIEIPSS